MASQESTESTPSNDGLSFSDTVYRCVCGELLDIHSQRETICPQCQRSYAPGFLEQQGGDETVMATLCERRTKVVAAPGEEDPLIGQNLGHFKIVEPLGQGGMGTVYRALDESLQRYVALKVILEGRQETTSESDSKEVQQLFQEARAQARVNHPNVVHIYFVDRADGAPFFAMELVTGSTLKDRLDDGPLPFDEVVRVALQVADALRHALRYDIVHGDIKPSNILTTDGHQVKISDFGLARRLSELHASEGVLAGTPNYLSPESAARESTDFRSDLYSLGVTLFELTFGKLPYSYETKSVEERLKAHRTRSVEFPAEWPDAVPSFWRDVLGRLLAKDREKRYQSYDELVEDLRLAQPLSLPSAGLLPRGMAWLADMFILFLVLVFFHLPVKLDPLTEIIGEHKLLESVIHWGTFFGIPLAVVLFQFVRGNTPGKMLFQLRVVDRHGAAPSRSKIVSRSAMQYLFLWLLMIFGTVERFGLEVGDGWIFLTVVLTLVAEMASAVFSKKRLSFHDRFLGTRVVLDTREEEE